MSRPCISFTDAIRLIGAKTCCECKSSLKTVRIGSTVHFLCNLLDCKTICFVRPQLVHFFLASPNVLLLHPLSTCIVSLICGIAKSRRMVIKFSWRGLEARPLFAILTQSRIPFSTMLGILVELWDCSQIVIFSTIEPQCCGLKKKISSIATGF